MKDAWGTTLSVFVCIAVSFRVQSIALPPVPAPSAAFNYLQLQILVIGSGDLVELSSLTSSCLADYAPQSVTASQGCNSSSKESKGSNTTKSTAEVVGNCQTVTLVLAAHGNAVDSVSFQDTLLVDLVDCFEAQNDGWKVQALKDAQGRWSSLHLVVFILLHDSHASSGSFDQIRRPALLRYRNRPAERYSATKEDRAASGHLRLPLS